MKSSNLTNHKVGIGLVSFLFILLIFLAISATAGTISGKVTDADTGSGVSQARVYVHDENSNGRWSADPDVDGNYTVTDLPSGNYKIEFDTFDNHVSEWYNNRPDFSSADTVTVTESSSIANIDAALEVGGSISGKMTDASETALSGHVEVYDSNQNRIAFEWIEADGEYTATGLPNGSHKVKFTADGNYFTKWYNNKADFDTAVAVAVSAPNITTGIDAVLAPSGGISGRMTDSGGTGISGYVYVYSSTDQYSYVAYAHTDTAGNYTVTGLANGDYKVKFDPDANYIDEWYNDKGDFNSANTVTVTAPDTTPDINAVLAPSGGISGKVANDTGGAIEGVTVAVYDNSLNRITSYFTDTNGEYSIAGLPAGEYQVAFEIFQPASGMCYKNEWYDQNPVAVTALNTTQNIDAVLAPKGSISGKVTNADGEPVSGFSITASLEKSWSTRGWARLYSDGNYKICLDKGNYKVHFETYETDYAQEWYDNKTSFNFADSITVTDSVDTANIDVVLADGGKISGRITNAAGEPIAGYVKAYDSNQSDDSGSTISYTWAAADGNYTLSGLAEGEYKVQFSGSSSGSCYLSEWYDDKHDFANAVPVSVTALNTTSNIDAVLAPSGSISGRVTDAAGKPIEWLRISASYSNTFGTRSLNSTNSNGEYTLCGLDTGSYKVHFEARGELDEWYNNKPDFESADSIAVTAPNDTAGIDAALEVEQATVTITPILMLLLQK